MKGVSRRVLVIVLCLFRPRHHHHHSSSSRTMTSSLLSWSLRSLKFWLLPSWLVTSIETLPLHPPRLSKDFVAKSDTMCESLLLVDDSLQRVEYELHHVVKIRSTDMIPFCCSCISKIIWTPHSIPSEVWFRTWHKELNNCLEGCCFWKEAISFFSMMTICVVVLLNTRNSLDNFLENFTHFILCLAWWVIDHYSFWTIAIQSTSNSGALLSPWTTRQNDFESFPRTPVLNRMNVEHGRRGMPIKLHCRWEMGRNFTTWWTARRRGTIF